MDGKVTLLEANQLFLFALTDAGKLCVWSVTGHEAKPYGGAGRAVDLPSDLVVVSMRCNCDGTKVHCFSMLLCSATGLFMYLPPLALCKNSWLEWL